MDEHNLPKSDFHRRSDLETSTKFVGCLDAEFGPIVVVQSVSTRQRFFLKEKAFGDRFGFLEELNRTKSREHLAHANLLRLVDYATTTKIDEAEESYKLRLFFEHHPNNLTREIRQRARAATDFALEELTYLLYDMVSACAFLQRHNINHGDVSPEVILRTEDGHFVLGDRLRHRSPFPQNLIDKVIRGDRLYLSPELFALVKARNSEGINRMDYFVSDVFILGLCLLEAGTMSDASAVFKRGAGGVDRERLAELVARFEKRYGGESLVAVALAKMLEVDPKRRPDFEVLKATLPPYQDVIQAFSDHSMTQSQFEFRKRSIFGSEKDQPGLLVTSQTVFPESGDSQHLTGYKIPSYAESVRTLAFVEPESFFREAALRQAPADAFRKTSVSPTPAKPQPPRSTNLHATQQTVPGQHAHPLAPPLPINAKPNYRPQPLKPVPQQPLKQMPATPTKPQPYNPLMMVAPNYARPATLSPATRPTQPRIASDGKVAGPAQAPQKSDKFSIF